MTDTHTPCLCRTAQRVHSMIGLLLAGLCVAAALVVVDAPGGHDVRPRAENHEIRPRMPAYDPQDEVDSDAVVVIPRPVEQPSPGVQGPTAFEPLPKPGNSVDAAVAAKDHAAQDATTIGALVIQGRGRHDCNQYNYTYCTRPTAKGFHYDPEQRACVPTTEPRAQLCNRGVNRFSSWERCRAICLHPGRISAMCFERALFIPCSRQDFVDLLWYYNGTTCTKWTFPDGLCPPASAESTGFSTSAHAYCLVHNKTSNSNSTDCEVSPSGACSLEQLRYTFFADMRAEGSNRCINAFGVTLLARRCLVGNNQFESLKAGQKACMEETVSFGTQLPPVQKPSLENVGKL